jgi:uridine phosphorylase
VSADPGVSEEWQDTIGEIATGWLFGDLDPLVLPRRLVLPLENPELFELDSIERYVRVTEVHRGIVLGDVGGTTVGILRSKLGAPAVALTVATAARMGAELIIGAGFCGGIDAALTCGCRIVPMAAVRGDGTSRQYAPPGYPALADVDLALTLAQRASASASSIVWSTDAVLLQSTNDVRAWSALGISAVDMEVAALYTVARLSGMRAAAVLTVSDSPGSGALSDPELLAAGYSEAFAAAIDVAASFPTSD